MLCHPTEVRAHLINRKRVLVAYALPKRILQGAGPLANLILACGLLTLGNTAALFLIEDGRLNRIVRRLLEQPPHIKAAYGRIGSRIKKRHDGFVMPPRVLYSL